MSRESRFWAIVAIAVAIVGVFIAYKQLGQGERSSSNGSQAVGETAREGQISGSNTSQHVDRQQVKSDASKVGSVTANGERSVAVGTVHGNVVIH
ncbi:MAG TPA: hypothetical protein VFW19_13580 [Allosphingosinicella sp.]|nr:hypothetical protein [Allosphingosinicella sp.]